MENINDIYLRGTLKDIEHSHDIDGISFNRAKMICKRANGREDIINLRFKSFSNPHSDGDEVCLQGNVRSYSYKNDDGNNKVVIYVFTYFDEPEDSFERDNLVRLSGRICKTNELRKTRSGKHNIHFIVANNLTSQNNSKRLNSYIPCIAWGKTAQQLSELSVNTKVNLFGELHSREHTKTYEDGRMEIRVAHELLVESFEVVE